jgi:hypothetical protein
LLQRLLALACGSEAGITETIRLLARGFTKAGAKALHDGLEFLPNDLRSYLGPLRSVTSSRFEVIRGAA